MQVCKCSKKEEGVAAGRVTQEGIYRFVEMIYGHEAYLIVLEGITEEPTRLYYNATTGHLATLRGASTLRVEPCAKKVCFELKD